ncbi:MAG: putative PBSX repressor [Candidatus Accumulibacter sp. BA-94]|uniref:helix-turn-helix domain-containing protein n=1 Tax=Accumulibacter sp. TaxID=2053492 RepID=UPI000448864D|nr:helix-turn-helix transcriptional regulator [Accumulibacter sp.]EXI92094.1 MAG: putative PBSX repressor [Candidatus Accumulibacter sp. BA-94]HRD86783.1 helix-turn-helix transcriptional regulator [Accumulibacter sp.]
MSDLDRVEIGGRIRQVRGDMTQKDFADRLGIGRTSVVRYEAGERSPDAEFIARAHAVLGIDPIWLLTGAGVGAPALTPEEYALLDNFRHSPPAAQKALKTTSDLLAQRDHPNGEAECA